MGFWEYPNSSLHSGNENPNLAGPTAKSHSSRIPGMDRIPGGIIGDSNDLRKVVLLMMWQLLLWLSLLFCPLSSCHCRMVVMVSEQRDQCITDTVGNLRRSVSTNKKWHVIAQDYIVWTLFHSYVSISKHSRALQSLKFSVSVWVYCSFHYK